MIRASGDWCTRVIPEVSVHIGGVWGGGGKRKEYGAFLADVLIWSISSLICNRHQLRFSLFLTASMHSHDSQRLLNQPSSLRLNTSQARLPRDMSVRVCLFLGLVCRHSLQFDTF